MPPDRAVQGIDHAVVLTRDVPRTAAFVTRWTGMDARPEGVLRAGGALGGAVALAPAPDLPPARIGAGAVHHIAFRVPDDAAQAALHRRLVDGGVRVSPVMDRDYFRSIYFREPGGVLLEIATDPPGFTRDEEADALGSALRVPAWLEPRRAEIEAVLAPLGSATPLEAAR